MLNLISRTGTLPHDLPLRFFIHLQLYQYGCSPPPRPPGSPWLLLLAQQRCQLFSASPLCHLFMKRPAASTIPRCQIPLFLAALGHSTVSTPNSKGELSVDPSVAPNTLRSSTRHWALLFSGRSRPGFTPAAIVPNITRWVSHSLLVRCTAPAKTRRRLRIVVQTLSHCAFLRALAYDIRWSVRCRRWKPMRLVPFGV